MAFTAEDVRAIAPGIPASLGLDPYIATATSITGILSGNICLTSFRDDQLDQIGIYLTAHLVYMSLGTGASGNNKRESIAKGDVDITKNVAKIGEGITGTTYGQMANMLSQGCLSTLDQPQVGMFSIGTNDDFDNSDFGNTTP